MVSSSSADWTSGEVAVSGGKLAFHRTGGEGPPLVLSHGLTDNGLCWTRLAEALGADYDIIMLDARGHGTSSRVGRPGAADPVRDLAEAIEGLGLNRVLVMGHSVGARASAGYAAAFPDRVRALVLEDPPLVPNPDAQAQAVRQSKFQEQVEKFRSMSEVDIRNFGRRQFPSWHDREFSAWTTSKRQVDVNALPVFRTSWRDEIAGLRAPTLLLHGEPGRGSMAGAEQVNEARSLNPNLRALKIPGAGHNVRRENFADVLLAVRGFLGEL